MVLTASRGVDKPVFSPDGQHIAALSGGAVRVWRAHGQGKPVTLPAHPDIHVRHTLPSNRSLTWSPDGSRILTAIDGGPPQIRNADGTDGQEVITVARDRPVVRIWRADGADKPIVLQDRTGDHHRVVQAVSWGPRHRRLVTWFAFDALRVWDLRSPTLQRQLRESTTMCLSADLRNRYLDEDAAKARAAFETCERSFERLP